MYLPRHFEAPSAQAITDLVRLHPLGTLITLDAQGDPVANEVPFLRVAAPGEPELLLAHVARANAVWQEHPNERPVRIVFKGPDAYISPNWYPSKVEHGKAVPTWNYTVVQASGRLTLLPPGSPELRDLLHQLTTEHEATQPHPWTMNDAPPQYIDSMLAAVVGLRVEVRQWVGKWKVSQNQPATNRAGVCQGLRHQGAHPGHEAMAELIQSYD